MGDSRRFTWILQGDSTYGNQASGYDRSVGGTSDAGYGNSGGGHASAYGGSAGSQTATYGGQAAASTDAYRSTGGGSAAYSATPSESGYGSGYSQMGTQQVNLLALINSPRSCWVLLVGMIDRVADCFVGSLVSIDSYKIGAVSLQLGVERAMVSLIIYCWIGQLMGGSSSGWWAGPMLSH